MKYMRLGSSVLLATALLLAQRPAPALGQPATAGAPGHRFYDRWGNPLATFDGVWSDLGAFYREALPERLTVHFNNLGYSLFHPEEPSIDISGGMYEYVARNTIAHETCHVGLFFLTKGQEGFGASVQNDFRFVDEGWANILAYRIDGKADAYRRYALVKAAVEWRAGRVSLAGVRDWERYFGGPASDAGHPFAYEVGSSFLFHLLDRSGQDLEKLRTFFETIGATRSLGQALSAYGMDESSVEASWFGYLSRVDVDAEPQVARLSPPDRAVDVSTGIRELTVEFSVDMDTSARCPLLLWARYGNVELPTVWRSKRLLAVPVGEGDLAPGQTYTISVGQGFPIVCAPQSAGGVWLTPRQWRFTTGR